MLPPALQNKRAFRIITSMKTAAVALLLLVGCKQYDRPSDFMEHGIKAAVQAAVSEAKGSGLTLSGGNTSTNVKPAHFEADYQINFDQSKANLGDQCLLTLSKGLPEQAKTRS